MSFSRLAARCAQTDLRAGLLGACAWTLLGAATALASGEPDPSAVENRLAGEASPYLQLHKTNPVDWYPWGREAFARAREEDKPIFLSVGYSTCYWCHVMEREVFSKAEIAAAMNQSVISIKVDREERPDVDEIYMRATQLLTGSGGWPNSVFLTPDGEPFYAGTYFPAEDAGGRPGFPRVVRKMAELWRDEPERVRSASSRIARALGRESGLEPVSAALPEPEGLLLRAADLLAAQSDPQHGGFGSRQKFPHPTRLELLLEAEARRPDPARRAALERTLDGMALGGIHDHLGGGFHRYAVEPTWSIPHFEKMLYDNAQLLGVYARAFAVLGRPLYRQVAEDVADHLVRDLRVPGGGFASAEDAEVDGHEGASYVWTRAEIETALGAEPAARFLSVYLLRALPGEEGGVVRVRLPVEPALERLEVPDVAALLAGLAPLRAKLLALRDRRPQPLRDDKVLAAWNGLAIRGFVEAAQRLDRPDYLGVAAAAADFVLAKLGTPDGGLRRSWIAGQARERGVLDDHAFLAEGLLALHAATGEARWLAAARRLADRMLADFEDPDAGGFFLTAKDVELLVRPRSLSDGALPSGNGVALRVLQDLRARPGGERYAASLLRATGVLASVLEEAPTAYPSTLLALASGPSSPPDAGVREADAGLPPLPRSRDHVHVALAPGDGAEPALEVRLEIDAGWHVNANPASLPFLVPTAVRLSDGRELGPVAYPEGKPFQPSFAPSALSVYEGTVRIPVRLPPGLRGGAALEVRYQACDVERCLPPDTTKLVVPAS